MSEVKKELPKTAWKKGAPSPNPAGRPKGTATPISRLRSTLNKLKGLEPEAIQIIEKVIKSDLANVSKDQIDMAKWVIGQINTLTRGAIAEESFKMDVREKNEESEKANGTTGAPAKPRLSLKIVSDDE